MKFSKFTASILAILGITAFRKNDEGKQILSDDEMAKLKEYGFSDKFLADYAAALADDFSDEQTKQTADESEDKRNAVLKGLLADTSARLAEASAQLEAIRKENADNKAAVSSKEQEIAALKDKVQALSDAAETDYGVKAGKKADAAKTFDINDTKQLGGVEGVMFSLENRPYNQRARAKLLAAQGLSVSVPVASSIDYERLREDLGAFYRISWRDRLQSFLTVLPTVETIFPLESGYQDLAVLVNIWLGEFSQAGNEASDFDKVTKGDYEFDTETLRMFNVMFAHKFRDLKALEKTWIGSLNKEGSDPIKWSFIEYILAETAKKLHNERELRRINGVRKDPDVNQPGKAMDAADGLYEWLRKKVDGYVDVAGKAVGKTVYQIKPFELPRITESNIGEVIYLGTSMIPSEHRDGGSLALYMPSHLIPKLHKYYEAYYGQNQDYKANIMYVKEYPAVKIIPIPNADNHERIFWTIVGNIHTFEDTPGEMINFKLEQQDWTLKVWSNWRESIWAYAVGYKYTKKSAMDGSRQMIWCNDYDLPSSYFVEATADTNPSAQLHTSIVTVANTATLEITDITDAKVGAVITLKCGSVDAGVTIKKSGNFELISADWIPNVGDVIKLMKRADGKFVELARSTASSTALQFAADETAPDLTGAYTFVTGANTQATVITDFVNAETGVVYTIYGSGSEFASAIANGGNFVLTADMTLSEGTYIQLVKADDGVFYEIARG